MMAEQTVIVAGFTVFADITDFLLLLVLIVLVLILGELRDRRRP
jgi:hypothetical protein